MSAKDRKASSQAKDNAKKERLKLIEELGASAFEHLRSNQPDSARQALLEAIDLSGQESSASRVEIVLRTYLAQAERMLGHTDAAVACFENVIERAQAAEFVDVEVLARVFLAELLKERGDYTRAHHHFELAYNCASYLKDAPAMELAAGNLGSVAFSLGHLEQACGWFKTAVDVQTVETGSTLAIWLGSLGLTMSELGQFDKAREYYQRAYDLAGQNSDPLTMSICRGSIGNICFEQKQYKEAQICYDQAQDLAKQAGDARRHGIWVGNIGISLSRQGDQDTAQQKLKEALAIAESVGDKQSMAAHLDSLGDCLKEIGDHRASDSYYRQAIELAQETLDRLGERIYLSNLARLKRDSGELSPAFEYFARAVEIFDEQRGFIKADDLKTSFADRGQELYRDIIATCLNMGKRVEALEYVGRAKSRALLDLLSNSPIDISDIATEGGAAVDSSVRQLIAREADLRAQIAQLERLYWQGDDPAGPSTSQYRGAQMSQEDTRKLYGEWRDVLNQLKRQHPNYASLVSSSTLKYSEIQALWTDKMLHDDTAVVEFFLTADYLMVAAAVSGGAGEPITHILMEPTELENLKSDIFTFLEMSSTEGWEVPLSLCKRLYKRLLEPVVSKLPSSISRLVLVPHGMLYHLPFSALHDGTGYLCQKYSVSYVPTVSLIPLLASAKRVQSEAGPQANLSSGSYLVSAISDYSKTREGGMVFSSRLRSSAGLEDLAYTMEEARSIAHLGGDGTQSATLITNEEVKKSLPAMFGQYEVVHFAGHAVFNHDEPLASGLVLSDGSILSAASILEGNTLRTVKGKLLVLSACQTGVNVVTEGGEILGLARALMYAGMPNLVLSLWEVADRSTASLMQDFHHALLNGWQAGKGTVADALRQAQLKAIADKQPIHAWAPFIHFGID
ncbi:MAG: CHAT domain-containing protein [Candidatus Obscuribacter sp.]|nr:CHAT domain-containing protein [Candidatus Obscuribacter sp.]